MAPLATFVHLWALLSLSLECSGQDSEKRAVRAIADKSRTKFEAFLEGIEQTGPDQLSVSTNCRDDFMTFLIELSNSNATEWPWIMVDSWGLPEAGFASGNTNWEGRMQQCKEVKSGVKGSNGEEIKGKYCNLGWPMYGTWSVAAGFGICIPSSCTEDDLFEIVQALVIVKVIEIPPFFPLFMENVTLRHCAEIPDFQEDPGAIGAVTVLCFFFLLGILGSGFDILKRTTRHKSGKTKVATSSVKCVKRDESPISEIVKVEQQQHINHCFKGDLEEDGYVKEPSNSNLNMTKEIPSEDHENNPEEGNSSNSGFQKEPAHIKAELCGSVLLSFSAIRHMQNVATFEHARGSIRCLNAIRFLSMCWIVLGHTWQIGVYITERQTAENLKHLFTVYMEQFAHEAIDNMNVAVDSFFLLSGLLTTISFLKKMTKYEGKPPCSVFGVYYFHRFWRLTPVYMLILMFYGTMFPYLGTGPFYPVPQYDSLRCRSSWWTHLIYLNNLIEGETVCMGWTWYLACDFQFYVMAPIFLSLLYWKPVVGVIMTSLGLCGNLISSIYLFHGLLVRQDTNAFTDIYVTPWTRCGSYFLGMFLGYVLVKYNFRLTMNKVGVAFGWIVALGAIFLAVYGTYFSNDWPVEATIAYLSVQRLLIAFGVGWIVLACCTGYGGFVNSILSWVGWVPLARLSYTGYLVHPIIVYFTYYSTAIQVYITYWNMIYYFLGNLMLTLGACFVITSFLELPFLALEKIMFRNVKT